jgi:hypothetical protein
MTTTLLASHTSILATDQGFTAEGAFWAFLIFCACTKFAKRF